MGKVAGGRADYVGIELDHTFDTGEMQDVLHMFAGVGKAQIAPHLPRSECVLRQHLDRGAVQKINVLQVHYQAVVTSGYLLVYGLGEERGGEGV